MLLCFTIFRIDIYLLLVILLLGKKKIIECEEQNREVWETYTRRKLGILKLVVLKIVNSKITYTNL